MVDDRRRLVLDRWIVLGRPCDWPLIREGEVRAQELGALRATIPSASIASVRAMFCPSIGSTPNSTTFTPLLLRLAHTLS